MKQLEFRVLVMMCMLYFCLVSIWAKEKHKIAFDGYTVESGMYKTAFTMSSEDTEFSDLEFWVLPAENITGDFSSYIVNINGKDMMERVYCSKPGWQKAYVHNKGIMLKKGENIITFVSDNKDLPQVKGLHVWRSEDKRKSDCSSINDSLEREFCPVIDNLKENNLIEISTKLVRDNDMLEPMCRPGVAFNQPYTNTFSLPIYYNAGDVASFYTQGLYDIEYTLYFFNEDPNVLSTSILSNKGFILQNIDVPKTGLYYLLIEARDEGGWGGVNVVVNNNTTYRHQVISKCSFDVFKDNPRWGIRVSNRDSCYNIFTTNSRSFDSTRDSDPQLWLKKRDWHGKEAIVAYSDNNSFPSDFNWGNNARIKS